MRMAELTHEEESVVEAFKNASTSNADHHPAWSNSPKVCPSIQTMGRAKQLGEVRIRLALTLSIQLYWIISK